jgi:uncharacterized protein YjdB
MKSNFINFRGVILSLFQTCFIIFMFNLNTVAQPVIVNPGFENGMEGWQNWDGSYVVTDTVHGGSKAMGTVTLVATPDRNWTGGGFGQDITGITVGKRYTASAWVMLSASVTDSNQYFHNGIILQFFDEAGKRMANNVSKHVITAGVWKKVTASGVCPEGAVKMTIGSWFDMAFVGGGNQYVDDFTIEELDADPVPATVEITAAQSTVAVDEFLTLTGKVLPSNADQKLVWSSSDEDVAVVSETGDVLALSNGKVIITATASNGVTGTFTVTVGNMPALLNPSFESGMVGWDNWSGAYVVTDTIHGGAKALGVKQLAGGGGFGQTVAGVTPGKNYKVTAWVMISQDVSDSLAYFSNAIAMQFNDADGKRIVIFKSKPVKKAGVWTQVEVDQGAVGGGNQYTDDFKLMELAGNPIPTSVKITAAQANVAIDGLLALTGMVMPAEANQALVWTSADETMATVSGTGEVLGKSNGKVIITATASNGVKADFEVTVGVTAISDLTQNSFQIYPNRISVGQAVHIAGATGTVSIFNINGQKLAEQQINSENEILNTSNLKTKGMYFVKMKTQNGTDTKKLIIE